MYADREVRNVQGCRKSMSHSPPTPPSSSSKRMFGMGSESDAVIQPAKKHCTASPRHALERTERVREISQEMSECPGCETQTRYLQQHVYIRHLPLEAWVDENELPTRAERDQLLALIKSFAHMVMGEDSDLERLLNMVNRYSGDHFEEVSLSEGYQHLMRNLCDDNHWPVPPEFTLKPVNSPAVLVSWRVLIFLTNFLTDKQKKNLEVPDGFAVWKQKQNQKKSVTIHSSVGNSGNEFSENTAVQVSVSDRKVDDTCDAHFKASPVRQETFSTKIMAINTSTTVSPLQANQRLSSPSVSSPQEKTVRQETFSPKIMTMNTPTSSPQMDKKLSSLSASQNMSLTPEKQYIKPLMTFDVYDSHFHQNRIAECLNLPPTMPVDTIMKCMWNNPRIQQNYPRYRVNLLGGINVMCDPECYPTSHPEDPKYPLAVGVHPKKVRFFTNEKLAQLTQLLENPSTVAFGEIGLDRTVRPQFWSEQERVLDEILALPSWKGKPVILHMRGQYSDHINDVGYLCLKMLKIHCSVSQGVHLHCFNGDSALVEAWTHAFQNCYFGFTAQVKNFNKSQIQGLQSIPEDRLLLETDAPYFGRQLGVRTSTPEYIGDVAVIIANMRNTSVEHILEITVDNTRRLYNL